ncbi:MAG TPA: SUMF1/EgtB/PvdO family nonheme iron enzyme [Pyrinomonadaceae bacterium]|nr:SUMF1/EgtB/PvdO family nonheme iron enzyme [Pyrinomonadaceae bacterium]
MKSCPTCNRTFEDTLTFCLVDGSILSAPFDPNAQRREVTAPESAPPTMTYPHAQAFTGSHAAPVESPPTASQATVPPTTLRSFVPTEGDMLHTDSPAPTKPAPLPTQPVQAAPASEPNSLPMKTMVAPAPEMVFQSPAISGAQSEPRQTIPSARSQPTSQLRSEGRKPLGLFLTGAFVLVIVMAGGLFWLIKHNKAANRPAASRSGALVNTGGSKATTPAAASFAESVNGSEIDLVFVKGGTFVMGSPASDPDRDQDEGPQTEVTVQGFHMSKYEITQAQYKAVMNANPSSFKGDTLPVDRVSWNSAVEFCRKLAQLTGHQYRLPTEAEWEYAARAGSTKSSTENVEATAWFDANSAGHPHAVGQKDANAFGLYDLNGNLWEWCQSKYKPYPYNATDGRESLQETDVRVLRGGSFESSARGCRSTYRRRVTPHPSASGFRIVLISP